MKSFLAFLALMLCLSPGWAQDPGEGDCSSEFIYNITKIEKCDEAGKCNSRTTSKVELAGVLSCVAPWGEFYRVCFKNAACLDGKVTSRRTAEGDVIYTSIISNPTGVGAYPKKFAVVMTTHMNALPSQLIVMGSDTKRFTELLFGEAGSASLMGKSARTKKGRISHPAFSKKPGKPVESAE